MLIIKFLSLLPLLLLYRVSDFLAFLAYRIIRYRRKVVIKNLQRSFPEKTIPEIENIAKDYYLNLTDIVVETIKGLTITPEDLIKRIKINNLQLLEEHLKTGVSVIIMTTHQGNWEWLLLSNSLEIRNGDVIAAFQKVKSFSDLMKKIRSRFGAKLIEKKNMVREMVKKDSRPKVFALVADQTPNDLSNRYWTNFLHQQTPFFSGAEKIAVKYGMVVLYVNMRRIRRGYYSVDFKEIGKPPYFGTDFPITKAYVESVEKDIQQNPSQWLWSHKRWKHIKQSEDEIN
jgi:KDO2-lipid IV(A) lauroyltransferase